MLRLREDAWVILHSMEECHQHGVDAACCVSTGVTTLALLALEPRPVGSRSIHRGRLGSG